MGSRHDQGHRAHQASDVALTSVLTGQRALWDAASARGFVHTAVSHRSTRELVAIVGPVVRGWLARRDRVFVNLAAERVAALRAALGEDADRVRWSDTYHWSPHPARRLRALQELVDGEERHGSGQLRYLGECAFPAGPPELVAEWERYDAVLNDALAAATVTVVCTYDAGTVPGGVTDHIASTHPFLGVDPFVPSDGYQPSLEYLAPPRTLSPLPESATGVVGRPTPAEARSLVRRVLRTPGATWSSRPVQAVDDLAVVATELVTNSWQVGAESIGVSCWRNDGEMGIQVDDDGPGLDDVFAGYRRPVSAHAGGRGLWIVRQMADLVEIASNGSGTSVRARVFERLGGTVREPRRARSAGEVLSTT